MKCSLITWCDFVFSVSPVFVFPVALSNGCENKRESFQLSSISMSVLDLYLLCMTLVTWIDKILFSIYKKEHGLLFCLTPSEVHYLTSSSVKQIKVLVFVRPSHDTRTINWLKLCNHVLGRCQSWGLQNSEKVIHTGLLRLPLQERFFPSTD